MSLADDLVSGGRSNSQNSKSNSDLDSELKDLTITVNGLRRDFGKFTLKEDFISLKNEAKSYFRSFSSASSRQRMLQATVDSVKDRHATLDARLDKIEQSSNSIKSRTDTTDQNISILKKNYSTLSDNVDKQRNDIDEISRLARQNSVAMSNAQNLRERERDQTQNAMPKPTAREILVINSRITSIEKDLKTISPSIDYATKDYVTAKIQEQALSSHSETRSEIDEQINDVNTKLRSTNSNIQDLSIKIESAKSSFRSLDYYTAQQAKAFQAKLFEKISNILEDNMDDLKSNIVPEVVTITVDKKLAESPVIGSYQGNNMESSPTDSSRVHLSTAQTNEIVTQCVQKVNNNIGSISSAEAQTVMTQFERNFHNLPVHLKMKRDIEKSLRHSNQNEDSIARLNSKMNELTSIERDLDSSFDQQSSDLKNMKADMRLRKKENLDMKQRLDIVDAKVISINTSLKQVQTAQAKNSELINNIQNNGNNKGTSTNEVIQPTTIFVTDNQTYKPGTNGYLDSLADRLLTIETQLATATFSLLEQTLEKINTKTTQTEEYIQTLIKDNKGFNTDIARALSEMDNVRTSINRITNEMKVNSRNRDRDNNNRGDYTSNSIANANYEIKVDTIQTVVSRLQDKISDIELNLRGMGNVLRDIDGSDVENLKEDLKEFKNSLNETVIAVVLNNSQILSALYSANAPRSHNRHQNQNIDPHRVGQLENEVRTTVLKINSIENTLSDLDKKLKQQKNSFLNSKIIQLDNKLASVEEEVNEALRESTKQAKKLSDISKEIDSEEYLLEDDVAKMIKNSAMQIQRNIKKLKEDVDSKWSSLKMSIQSLQTSKNNALNGFSEAYLKQSDYKESRQIQINAISNNKVRLSKAEEALVTIGAQIANLKAIQDSDTLRNSAQSSTPVVDPELEFRINKLEAKQSSSERSQAIIKKNQKKNDQTIRDIQSEISTLISISASNKHDMEYVNQLDNSILDLKQKLKSNTREISRLDADKSNLEDGFLSYKKKIRAWIDGQQSALDLQKANMESLEASLVPNKAQIEGKVDKALNSIANLRSDITTVDQTVNTLKTSYTILKGSYDTKMTLIDQSRKEFTSRLAIFEDSIDDLRNSQNKRENESLRPIVLSQAATAQDAKFKQDFENVRQRVNKIAHLYTDFITNMTTVRRDVVKLQDGITRFNLKVITIDDKASQLEQNNRAVEFRLKKSKDDINELQNKVTDLTTSNNDNESKNKVLVKSVKDLNQSYNKLANEVSDNQDKTELSLKRHSNDIKTSTQQLTNMKSQLSTLRRSFIDFKIENEEKINNIDKKLIIIDDTISSTVSTTKQLQQSSDQTNISKTQFKNLKESVQKVQSALNTQAAKTITSIDSQSSQLREHNNLIVKIRDTIRSNEASNKNNINNLKTTLQNIRAKQNILAKDRDDMLIDIESVKTAHKQLQQAKNTISDLQSQSKNNERASSQSIQAAANQIRNENEAYQSDITDKFNSVLKTMKRIENTSISNYREIKNEAKSLKSDIVKTDKQSQSDYTQLNDQFQKYFSFSGEFGRLKSRMSTINSRLLTAESDIDTAQTEIKTIDKTLSEYTSKPLVTRNEIRQLSNTIHLNQASIRSNKVSVEQNLLTLTEKVQNLETTTSDTKNSMAKATASNELNDQIRGFRTEIFKQRAEQKTIKTTVSDLNKKVDSNYQKMTHSVNALFSKIRNQESKHEILDELFKNFKTSTENSIVIRKQNAAQLSNQLDNFKASFEADIGSHSSRISSLEKEITEIAEDVEDVADSNDHKTSRAQQSVVNTGSINRIQRIENLIRTLSAKTTKNERSVSDHDGKITEQIEEMGKVKTMIKENKRIHHANRNNIRQIQEESVPLLKNQIRTLSRSVTSVEDQINTKLVAPSKSSSSSDGGVPNEVRSYVDLKSRRLESKISTEYNKIKTYTDSEINKIKGNVALNKRSLDASESLIMEIQNLNKKTNTNNNNRIIRIESNQDNLQRQLQVSINSNSNEVSRNKETLRRIEQQVAALGSGRSSSPTIITNSQTALDEIKSSPNTQQQLKRIFGIVNLEKTVRENHIAVAT